MNCPYLSLLLAIAACAPAQTRPEVARFKQSLREHLERLPDYSCGVTIERSRKKSRKAAFEQTDRVRLEIGLIGQRELFGWPGGHRIEEADVARLVGGTIGNGDFALSARAVLALPDGAFESAAGDSRLDFTVDALRSDWVLQSAEGQVQTGYRGSVWFDPESGRAVKLQITASGKPLHRLGFQSVTKALQYGFSREANGLTQLLPAEAELHIVEPRGAEARNQTRFHDCRQFTAESRLVSAPEANDGTQQAGAGSQTPLALPPQFEIPLDLISAIDSDTAAVGDLVSLRVGDAVRHRGETPIAKDSTAIARISRLELDDAGRHLELAILVIESGGKQLRLDDRRNFTGRTKNTQEFRGNSASGAMASLRSTASPVTSAEVVPIVGKARLELPAGTRLILRSSAPVR